MLCVVIAIYRQPSKAHDLHVSSERLFDNKFIDEVNNMSYLVDNKEYHKMKLSRIIDSFIENSSIIGNSTVQSNLKESQASMFSKTSTLHLIPERKTLKVLEKDPHCRFAAQLLNQKLVNRMIADRETTRKAIMNIQQRLLYK